MALCMHVTEQLIMEQLENGLGDLNWGTKCNNVKKFEIKMFFIHLSSYSRPITYIYNCLNVRLVAYYSFEGINEPNPSYATSNNKNAVTDKMNEQCRFLKISEYINWL